jgi:hypothetical protein
MVEFNIYVMFKLCKLFFNLIRAYMIIINYTFIIDSRQQSEIYVFAEKQTRNAHQRLIGSVIVSVLASSAVDRGFESRSGQTMFCTHILTISYLDFVKIEP